MKLRTITLGLAIVFVVAIAFSIWNQETVPSAIKARTMDKPPAVDTATTPMFPVPSSASQSTAMPTETPLVAVSMDGTATDPAKSQPFKGIDQRVQDESKFLATFRVRDTFRTPIVKAQLMLIRIDSPAPASLSTTTNAMGVATADLPAQGRYQISLEQSNGLKRQWIREISRGAGEIDLEVESPGIFHGRVDAALTGAIIKAGNKLGVVQTLVSIDGAWELPPLSPGRYTIILRETTSGQQDPSMSELRLHMPAGPDGYTLGAGERQRIDLQVRPSGRLILIIIDPDGKAIEGGVMALKSGIMSIDSTMFENMHGSIPNDGRHEFNHLPEGDWDVFSEDKKYQSQRLKVHMESGETQTLKWQLQLARSSLQGRIVGVSAGNLFLSRKGEFGPSGEAVIDENGSFKMENLVPGKYELYIDNEMRMLVGRFVTDVEVGEGLKDLGDIPMPKSVMLKGMVKPVGGDLPAGFAVKAMRDGRMVGMSMVGMDGAFTFEVEGKAAELQVGPFMGEPLSKTPWNGTDAEVTLEVPGEKW